MTRKTEGKGNGKKSFSKEQDLRKVEEILAKLKEGKASEKEVILLKKLASKYGIEVPAGGNDFSWWNKYPVLTKDAANVNWQYIPGMGVQMPNGTTLRPTNIAVVKFVNLPGYSKAATSAVNLQFRNLWLDMHRKYRGIGSYQQSDLGITMIAVADVFGMISEIERLYGLAYSYKATNRMFPRDVLLALLGGNASLRTNIELHLADFRYGINRLIEKCSQLCLPKGLSYIQDRSSLSSFIYCDSEDERAEIIAFTTAAICEYTPTLLHTGGSVAYKQFSFSTFSTYEQLLSLIESRIDVLLSDSDIARMCSDLLAAYGSAGVERLASMPEDYTVYPQYSTSILRKLHNSDIVGINGLASVGTYFSSLQLTGADSTALTSYYGTSPIDVSFVVFQNNDVIHSTPIIGERGRPAVVDVDENGTDFIGSPADGDNGNERLDPYFKDVKILDTWEGEPSQEVTFESCLWKINAEIGTFDNGTHKAAFLEVTSCSTIVLTEMRMYAALNGSISYSISVITNQYTFSAYVACSMSKFDWHPFILLCDDSMYLDDNSTITMPNIEDIYGDFDHVTSVPSTTVKKVHDAAILSAFKVDATSVNE